MPPDRPPGGRPHHDASAPTPSAIGSCLQNAAGLSDVVVTCKNAEVAHHARRIPVGRQGAFALAISRFVSATATCRGAGGRARSHRIRVATRSDPFEVPVRKPLVILTALVALMLSGNAMADMLGTSQCPQFRRARSARNSGQGVGSRPHSYARCASDRPGTTAPVHDRGPVLLDGASELRAA